MDNLTHTLVGVLLARAGLRRLTPQATALCVVAANIPDIDIVAATSPINYLTYHRHLTHSLLAVPAMAALAVGFVALAYRISRREGMFPWGRAFSVAFVAALTHPLLDLANSYGVRLWLPFSGRWYSWDVLFVVDLWVWAILLLAALGPMLMRLVQREIGVTATHGQGAALAGLLLLVVFLGAKGVIHQRAVETLDAFSYEGAPALRVAAFPAPLGGNPFQWQALVETETYYQLQDLDLLLGSYDPTAGLRLYKESPGPAMQAVLGSESGAGYARFAQYLYAQVHQTPEGYVVEMSDLRFRRPGRVGFRYTVVLDEQYRVVSDAFAF
jgi:inner membrane protein